MKAVTLTQPWATLVAIGAKKVETRSWSTNHRGPLVIHAAKGLAGLGRGATDDDLWRLLGQQPFETALRVEYGTAERAFNAVSYRRGAIVAVADLVDVLPTGDPATLSRVRAHGAHDWELDFGDYSEGRYAWFLGNVHRIEPAVICRGAQGLWTVDEPIASAIASRTGCTGLSASWCPIHGDCACPKTEGEALVGLDDPRCPLHAPESLHAAPTVGV